MAYIPRDKFAQRAKQEGYRARSAYKLLDLQRKFKVLKCGDTVLDLGAAPGSWAQVAAGMVGGKGRIAAVDVASIKPFGLPFVHIFQKDILDEDFVEFLAEKGYPKFNVLLSDIAPNTTGIKERDQALSHELASRVLEAAIQLLKKRGNLVIKVFEGPDAPQLIQKTKKHFSRVNVVKPEASTKGSKERYIVAQNYI